MQLSQQNIQYISQNNIDKKKWDACINKAGNGLLYAYSFYLDSMAKQWDALILGDYEIVMPLPFRKRWSYYYLFQPFLTPILGVFGNNLSSAIIDHFITQIPSKFRLWDISFNHFNPIVNHAYSLFHRENFILPLNRPYEAIRSKYSENIRRNIAKAEKAGCILQKKTRTEDIINLCEKEWPKFTHVRKETFADLKKNYDVFKPFAYPYGVYDVAGKLVASCIFLVIEKRAYYWLVGNDPVARDLGASSMLIDAFIRDFASKEIIFDFEGSDKKSISAFYQKFGALPEPYTTLYRNLLPFPLHLLKKTPQNYQALTS